MNENPNKVNFMYVSKLENQMQMFIQTHFNSGAITRAPILWRTFFMSDLQSKEKYLTILTSKTAMLTT